MLFSFSGARLEGKETGATLCGNASHAVGTQNLFPFFFFIGHIFDKLFTYN